MKFFIDFVLKYPRSFIVVLLIITILLGDGIMKLEFDNSIESLLPKSNDEYRLYEKTNSIYGDNGKYIIAAISDDDIWNEAFFRKNDQLIRYLEEYETFNADLENKRLDIFSSLIQEKRLYTADLINAYNGDDAFQSFLIRKLGKKVTLNALLDSADLTILKKQIESVYQLKQSESIEFILSPLTAEDISGSGDSLEVYPLVEKDENNQRIIPATPEAINLFKKRLKRNPAYLNGIYTENPVTHKITDFGMVIKFKNIKDQDPIARELLDVMENFKGLKIIPMGAPIGMIRFSDYMQRDLFVFLPVVMFVVLMVFFFNFRSFRGVLIPFLSVCMAQVWTLGLMGHLGIKITSVGISLPPLICSVGSSYAIHILNQYYSDFKIIEEQGLGNGLRICMSHISMTVLLAAFTTFVAFMTLAPTQISAISEWGISSGLGVFFALFISVTLIPACLRLMPHKMPALLLSNNNTIRETIADKLVKIMAMLSTRHYLKVLVVIGLMIPVSIVGLLRLQVESNFISYFKQDDPFRLDYDIIQKKFLGSSGFSILLDSGEEDGIKNPEFLKTVESIREWLTKKGNEHLNIGRTDAFTDFIKTMHFAMNQDDPAYYTIPDNKLDILDYLELYGGDDENSDGRPDEFESYIDPDYRVCNIILRICPKEKDTLVGTAKVEEMIHDIKTHLNQTLPSDYTYKITGFAVMDTVMSKLTIGGQVQSLFLCLVVIFIIVTLLFSNIKAGLLSLIPMSVAVVFNFGIMGWAGIRLDMVTSIIAAITIGIGVDDTIHFLNTFKYYSEKGYDLDATIIKTLSVSGKAIIYTSLALIFGFMVLTTSRFNPILLFGTLMAVTMVFTTMGALLILPAVIKATGVNLEASEARCWQYINLGRVFGLERF